MIILVEQQFRIWVYILNIDFRELNFKVATTYFDKSGIIWELSISNA